jgi:hypothetical protein
VLARKFFGEDLVVFRTEQGTFNALGDAGRRGRTTKFGKQS